MWIFFVENKDNQAGNKATFACTALFQKECSEKIMSSENKKKISLLTVVSGWPLWNGAVYQWQRRFFYRVNSNVEGLSPQPGLDNRFPFTPLSIDNPVVTQSTHVKWTALRSSHSLAVLIVYFFSH
jgi:hypothetical protein